VVARPAPVLVRDATGCEAGRFKAFAAAAGAAIGLRYLKGGGPGAFIRTSGSPLPGAVYHSLTLWGLIAISSRPTLALSYQVSSRVAAVALSSAPVIFGESRRRGADHWNSGLLAPKCGAIRNPAEQAREAWT